MSWTQSLSLENAKSVYSLANTPLYVLRNLKQDAAVTQIARSRSSEEILHELSIRKSSSEETLDQTVMPFVLLVALGSKNDLTAVKEAERFSGSFGEWFSTIARAILLTTSPTSLSKLEMTRPPLVAAARKGNVASSTTAKLSSKGE